MDVCCCDDRLDSALVLLLARALLLSPPPLAVRIEESESELDEVDIPPAEEEVEAPPNTEASLSFQLDDLLIVVASISQWMYRSKMYAKVSAGKVSNEHPHTPPIVEERDLVTQRKRVNIPAERAPNSSVDTLELMMLGLAVVLLLLSNDPGSSVLN